MSSSRRWGGAIAVLLMLCTTRANAQNIIHAVERGDIAQVRRLLQTDPSLVHTKAADGRSLLFLAVERNQRDIVGVLVEKGVDLKGQTTSPEMALLEAAKRGHTEIAVYLVTKGADHTLANFVGSTPLHFAAMNRDKTLIGRLIEAGADINATRADGSTPLLRAIPRIADDKTDSAIRPVVALLLTRKADPNLGNEDGMTPLHTAAQSGLLGTVTSLLNAKADVNPRTKNDLTPFALAKAGGHQKVMALLKQHGGID